MRPPNESYLNAKIGIRSWLLTTDHKRIALLYFASITFFFAIGGLAATLIRYELITLTALLIGGLDTGLTFYEPYSTFYATG
jgi:cytochrome c oxidase subunit 1